MITRQGAFDPSVKMVDPRDVNLLCAVFTERAQKPGTRIRADSGCPNLFLTAARGESGEIGLLLSCFDDDALTNDTQDDTRTYRSAEIRDGALLLSGSTSAFIRYTPKRHI